MTITDLFDNFWIVYLVLIVIWILLGLYKNE